MQPLMAWDLPSTDGMEDNDLKSRLNGINARFSGVDARLEKLDARLHRIDARFSELERLILEEGARTRSHLDALLDRTLDFRPSTMDH